MFNNLAKKFNQGLEHLSQDNRVYLTGVMLLLISFWLYVAGVLRPHQYQFFSLIDDGQSIVNSSIIDNCLNKGGCNSVSEVVFETQFGRFRPGYWFFQFLVHKLFGLNAQGIHMFRMFFLGTLSLVALLAAMNTVKKSLLALIIGSVIFITNFSFTENFVRLGPVEPYQLLLIALFSLLYLNQEKLSSLASKKFITFGLLTILILACLIKETSIILVPVVFVCNKIKNKKDARFPTILLAVPLLVIVAGRYFSRPASSATNYVENYSLTVVGLFTNVGNYLSLLTSSFYPFYWLAFLSIAGLFFLRKKHKMNVESFAYWSLLLVFSVAILIPWRFTLERYLLIPVFSFSIVAATLLSETLLQLYTHLKKRLSPVLVLLLTLITPVLLANAYFAYLPLHLSKTLNYTRWYAEYLRFEHDQTAAIASTTNDVYLNAESNLNNWEVLYELPIHLEYVFQSPKPLPTYQPDIPEDAVLFSSTSLEKQLPINEIKEPDYRFVSGKDYTINQIDSKLFASQFKYRPLQTLFNPPLLEESFYHKWELWQKN